MRERWVWVAMSEMQRRCGCPVWTSIPVYGVVMYRQFGAGGPCAGPSRLGVQLPGGPTPCTGMLPTPPAHATLSSRARARRLQRRSVARVEPVPALPPGRWDRLMGGLTVRTGITPLHLRIACQTAASYGLVMVLTGVDASYLALWERPIWAMLTTISVAETSIGAVYKKGSLRVVGTVVGMALGLATLYLAVLINGLNHDNHPAKVRCHCAGVRVGDVGADVDAGERFVNVGGIRW